MVLGSEKGAGNSGSAKLFRNDKAIVKVKFAFVRGGVGMRGERKIVPKNCFLLGKRHDKKILNVQILLSEIWLSLHR